MARRSWCFAYQSVADLAQVGKIYLRLEELTDTSLNDALVQSLAEHDLGVVLNVEFSGDALHGALLELTDQVSDTEIGDFVNETSNNLALSLLFLDDKAAVLADVAVIPRVSGCRNIGLQI